MGKRKGCYSNGRQRWFCSSCRHSFSWRNPGARRFLLRGLANVNAEWSLLAAAFNLRSLGKIWSKGLVHTTNRATAAA